MLADEAFGDSQLPLESSLCFVGAPGAPASTQLLVALLPLLQSTSQPTQAQAGENAPQLPLGEGWRQGRECPQPPCQKEHQKQTHTEVLATTVCQQPVGYEFPHSW